MFRAYFTSCHYAQLHAPIRYTAGRPDAVNQSAPFRHAFYINNIVERSAHPGAVSVHTCPIQPCAKHPPRSSIAGCALSARTPRHAAHPAAPLAASRPPGRRAAVGQAGRPVRHAAERKQGAIPWYAMAVALYTAITDALIQPMVPCSHCL